MFCTPALYARCVFSGHVMNPRSVIQTCNTVRRLACRILCINNNNSMHSTQTSYAAFENQTEFAARKRGTYVQHRLRDSFNLGFSALYALNHQTFQSCDSHERAFKCLWLFLHGMTVGLYLFFKYFENGGSRNYECMFAKENWTYPSKLARNCHAGLKVTAAWTEVWRCLVSNPSNQSARMGACTLVLYNVWQTRQIRKVPVLFYNISNLNDNEILKYFNEWMNIMSEWI